MKVQRSHLRLALVVLVAAVIFSIVGYLRPGARPAARPGPSAPPLIATAPAAGTVDPMTIPGPLDVDLARAPLVARDPFLFGDENREMSLAPVAQVSLGPDPQVRSILYSSTRRLAIVGGRIVGVGDQIGAYRVAEIEPGAVVFTLPTGERRRFSVYAQVPAGLTR